MRKIPKKYLVTGLLSLAGLAAGFMYWRFIGCSSGSCPITSHWYTSGLAGGLLGYFSGDSISDYRNRKAKKEK
jgi:hypothetical protein